MPYGVVIEAIHGAPKREQVAIKNMMVKIDFQNAEYSSILKSFLSPEQYQAHSAALYDKDNFLSLNAQNLWSKGWKIIL